jgi:hypothetical protein
MAASIVNSHGGASDKSELAIIGSSDNIESMSDTDDALNVIVHLKSRFGTQTRLAAAAGVRQNTITDRKNANSLTHQQMRSILQAAPKMGVKVDPWDFFPELRRSAQERSQ